MTENKRFYLDENGINDREYEFSILGEDELVDIINELNDEHKQLKMGIDSLKLLVQNWEALDEEKDEQLDKQNQALKKFYDENEHIKKIIQNYNANEYKHSSDALADIMDILEKRNKDDNGKRHDEEKWGNQDNRYWIEEIKSDWTPFVDKSDVLDYDKILYVLHDNQAFEDYPVAMSSNLNLLVGLCDRLNEYEIEVQQLRKQLTKKI